MKSLLKMSKKEFEGLLVKKFPNLYKDMYGDMRVTCMAWGVETGPGWREIIFKLSGQLEEEIKAVAPAEREYYRAMQVKEKFGGLRFYMTSETPKMESYIEKAEAASYKTCEVCGAKGKVRKLPWILTLCNEHFKVEDAKFEKIPVDKDEPEEVK